MENKYRVIIICMVFVVLAGMIFDVNHRANKFEQKKMQESQQTVPKDIAANLNNSSESAPKTDTSEVEFMAMAQNAKMKAQRASLNNLPEDDQRVSVPDLDNVPEFNPNSSEEQEDNAEIVAKNKIHIPEYGISVEYSKIPVKYSAHDSQGSKYYFVPATKGRGILGAIVKVDKNNEIVWQKILKYERMQAPNVRLLTFISKTLKIYFSQKNGIGAYPINILEDGKVQRNPYAPVYNSSLPPENYVFRLVKPFKYNEKNYAVYSFINLKPPAGKPVVEEFYIYKPANNGIVRRFMVMDRVLGNISEVPDVPQMEILVNGSSIAFQLKSDSGRVNKSIQYGPEIFNENLVFKDSLAPTSVGPGIKVLDE